MLLKSKLLIWIVAFTVMRPGAIAQEPQTGKPRETDESLRSWQWFQELQHPDGVQNELADCLLPAAILDKARADLADLRLRDAKDREVPFALRIRRPQVEKKSLPHTTINQGKLATDEAIVTMTLDLGEARVDHNAVEILTVGSNFRRRVEVEGSDKVDKDWVVLLDQAVVMHVRSGTQEIVEAQRLDYAPSRFRYLRVRVFPDRNLVNDRPQVSNVTVLWLTRSAGLDVRLPAQLGQREDATVNGHAVSAWTIEFSSNAVPCYQLSFDVTDENFVRAYHLELVRANEPNRRIAQGEWRSKSADEKKPLEIRLDAEVMVQNLRLVVTDDRNPPLKLTAVRYHAAARQVLFEASNDLAWPLKAYFGNPHAKAANYDFARLLPDAPIASRVEWASAGAVENPNYAPGDMAWMERSPWLIYVLLVSVSLILLVILVVLVLRISKTESKHAPAEDRAPSP